jgi:8-oxo-dGTP diphosphatase
MRLDTTRTMPVPAIQCIGAIITDASGRLLLVRRGREPEAGRWTLPGGRIEPGESDTEALVREVREETGLIVEPGPLVGAVRRPAPGGAVFDIRDYRASVTGGALAAGSDAAGACWAGPAELAVLPLTTGLATTLTGWGVLTAPEPPPGLIAEATRRAGVIWLSAGSAAPRPAWHIWRATSEAAGDPPPPGAAYVLTGPGEQPLPELADADEVTVAVPSKESGGLLVTWTARASRVEPGSAEWEAVIGQLAAARLNARTPEGEASPAGRWARTCTVFRLARIR